MIKLILFFATLCSVCISAFVVRSPPSSSWSPSSSTTQLFYSKVFVAGGSRGVGRYVVEKLLEADKDVVCLVRDQAMAEELGKLGAGKDQGGAW